VAPVIHIKKSAASGKRGEAPSTKVGADLRAAREQIDPVQPQKNPARRSRNRTEEAEKLTADGTDEHGFNTAFIRVDP
jgi:hypothetical protein